MILASGLIVLAAYALLIEAWRAMLRVWNSGLPALDAAHIWFVSNLGKYVPGKVWQIAAMGAMAEGRGVPPVAAIGSSIVLNAMSVLTGVAIALAFGAADVAAGGGSIQGATPMLRGSDTTVLVGVVIAGGLLLAAAPILVPRLAALVERFTGRALGVVRIPLRALLFGVASTTAAWLLYGLAFRMFAGALAPRAAGGLFSYTAVYTGSYLAGYLALFAPGGLGVRESALVLAMPRMGLVSTPDAVLIAVASRLWLTVLEVGPGIAFLARGARRSLTNTVDDGTT